MKAHKARIPTGLRRMLAVVAIASVAVAGWQLNTSSPSGIGVMGLPGATADPTGPPGPTGGPDGMNGGQFQPPGLPPQQPEYQGGNNLPPLDQNNGISIYNTGAQGAPQQAPGQRGAQQPQGQQPQHGTQIPDYQTATPYTQGPGKANPDYRVPQQGNQAQQGQQQQQPSQAPTQTQQPQNKQDDSTRQRPNDNDQQDQQDQKKCEFVSGYTSAINGQIAYSSSSQFEQQVGAAAQSWNDLGGIKMRPAASSGPGSSNSDQDSSDKNSEDSSSTGAQVEISDIDDPAELWGGEFVHSSRGPDQIILNLARLDTSNPAQIQSVIAHELGHAAGLSDSTPGQLMNGFGELPVGPQAGDAELFKQLSTSNLGQQCATLKLEQFIEHWCPGGDTGWIKGVCNAVGAAGDYLYGFGAETLKMIWDTVSAIPNTIAFLDDFIPGYAFDPAVRHAINSYFENFGWDDVKQLANGALNDFIEHDLWTSGKYAEWAGRMTPKILLLLAGGITAVTKFVKVLNKFRDGLKVVVDIAEQASKIASEISAIPKGGGQLNSLAEKVSALKLAQEQAAEMTNIASEIAFGETGGIAHLPDGTMMVLPANILQKAAMVVGPDGAVTVLRNVDLTQFLQYVR
ncbi:hypothetical protein [Mycobacterium sp. NPDC050853]|uniref:hypothetical protein n=1 Tax=Mycobacterium sp. NPDC050853 TaxID=3155160 RepID=UPI00340633A7